MASAFERVVKSVVQELDHSQELTPVNSLWSSAGFQPYCLLGRRPSSSWFWRPRYKCVSLSLRDILEPDAPEPAVEQDGPFHFHETMDGQLKGSVKLAVPGQGKISGKAAGSSSSSASVNVCMLRVAPSTWEAMRRERRLRKPEHKILQMQKEVEITQTHKQEGSGQFALPGAICLQGKGQGHMSRKKTVTIPSGTILAFRVAQLIIDPDWDILLFPNKKQRTFSGPLQAGRTGPGSQPEPSLRISDQRKFLSDGLMEDQLETTEDFQGLQLEVGVWAAGLEGLSEEPCGQLLGGLGQVLQDEHALEALEELLERGLCGGQVEPQDGPVGAILECLVLPSRQLEEELAGPVSYLLGALAVLSETQHVLLAEVLEMGALSEVFRLVRGPGLKGRAGLDAWSPHLPPPILSCQVRSLLEQSSPWQERRAVSLPPELLGSSWGAEAPSWVLLEECGLAPQAGDPQVCWEPEARCCTSALYACLALLSKLSPPC
ncbi:gasdermin-D isoform X2 [Camelus bactrianus]|uniref:Gasdermin-D isoform X2 n=1 Tax=Camelus bactrianus TaxID=9837 RepID=A0AC58PG01_CAMBA